MLYYILRPVASIALCIYFRKIYLTGTEHLPKAGGVVFAINHPTAFIDPIPITSFFFRFITHFILRGDMFDSPMVGRILASMKMVPIFRFRDGFKSMRKNQETMERMEELLSNGGNIIIMAEGVREHEKRLRPIQKGTARMVFGSYGKYKNKDLQVVPVGINFTHALKERSILMYDFGKPIPIKDYLEDYELNDRRAITRLTKEIGVRLKKRVIHVADPTDDQLADDVLDIFRHERNISRLPFLSKKRSLLESEIKIVQELNQLAETDKNQLKEITTEYYSLLKKYHFTDFSIAKRHTYNALTIIGLLLLLPVFIVGYILNIAPISYAYHFVKKKVKDPLFYSSVLFAMTMLFYWVYWHIIGLVLAIVDIPQVNGWGELAIWFFIPLTGLIALNYKEIFGNWRAASRFKKLKKAEQEKILAWRNKVKSFFSDSVKSKT